MNTKFGIWAKTVLFLAGVAVWSVTVLADGSPNATAPAMESEIRSSSTERASEAAAEAASEAAEAIRNASRLALDIRLVDPTSVQAAND